MFGKLIKSFVLHIVKPLVKLYLSTERKYRYEDISLTIKPGVFHPGMFFSTKILLNYIKNMELGGKTLLELGAGSGLISIYAAKKGAVVTSLDINPKAIENIAENARRNDVTFNIVHSNLFANIPQQYFDFIIINPPFFDKKPENDSEYAWYCGENFEYFEHLFSQLLTYIKKNSRVFMILSDQGNIGRIEGIAKRKRFKLEIIFQKRYIWEEYFIFSVQPVT